MNKEQIKFELRQPPKPQLSRLEQVRKARKEILARVMIRSDGKIAKQLTQIMRNQVSIVSQQTENSQILVYLRDLLTINANFIEKLAQQLIDKDIIDEMAGIKKTVKKEVKKKNEKK
jgi:hypothetical protein